MSHPDSSAGRSSSRGSSSNPQSPSHRPHNPSGLRQSQFPPPSPNPQSQEDPMVEQDRAQLSREGHAAPNVGNSNGEGTGYIEEPQSPVDARTSLLNSSQSNNGTFFRRPRYRRYNSFETDGSAPFSRDGTGGLGLDGTSEERFASGFVDEPLAKGFLDRLLGRTTKRKATNEAARAHGVRNSWWIYAQYYLPFCNWLPQYKWSYLKGDMVAAITVASFYIPLSLSYADNLAHTPPLTGLYSFCYQPLVYAFFGTSTLMMVGPEAAGSLLVGSVVLESMAGRSHHDEDRQKNAQVAGMTTALSGAIIFGAGIARLGFLDSVLSRPFLRGFISAIGIVLFFGQLIPELGLEEAAAKSEAAHGSLLSKFEFVISHWHEANKLSGLISLVTVVIVLVCRSLKTRLQPRYNWVVYIPDRAIVVIISALLSWKLDWEGQGGVDILNDIRSTGHPFKFEWPFQAHNFKHVNDAFGTGFVIALLGFFESSVAAKSIKSNAKRVRKTVKMPDGAEAEVEEDEEGIKGMTMSPNRELLALGLAQFVGGCGHALPAFGGYGRTKVNAQTGARTPASSLFLAIITFICVAYLLPWFYYIPKPTLAALITVVSFSLLEEAPHDIAFFYRISGWSELFLMFLVFLTTFFWNLRIGIAAGIGFSLLRLVQHSCRSRIQILGRVPGTNSFENAELYSEEVENVRNCLIVKFPEPLTFASTGGLRDRLRRLEIYGTSKIHPALPRLRDASQNQNMVFDIHGVTSMDPAATQVLAEIVKDYVDSGTRVFFCRVPSKKGEVWRLMKASGIVDMCGGEGGFFSSVEEALKATERSRTLEEIVGNEAVDEEMAIGSSSVSTSTTKVNESRKD